MCSSLLRSHLFTAGIRKLKFPKPLKLNFVLNFNAKELFKLCDRMNGKTHTAVYFCGVAHRLIRNIRNVDL